MQNVISSFKKWNFGKPEKIKIILYWPDFFLIWEKRASISNCHLDVSNSSPGNGSIRVGGPSGPRHVCMCMDPARADSGSVLVTAGENLAARAQITTIDSSGKKVNFLLSFFLSRDGLYCPQSRGPSTVLAPYLRKKNAISLMRLVSHELGSDHSCGWLCGFGRITNRWKVGGSSSSPFLQPTSFSGKIWINSKILGKWLVAPHGT